MTNIFEQTLNALKNEAENAQAGLSDKVEPIFTTLTDTVGAFEDIPQHYFDQLQPQITDQLNAINVRAQNSVDSILSACEAMMAELGNLPEETQNAFQNQINTIFESSSFQDLISQHTKEIGLLMNDLTDDMTDLKDVISGVGKGDPRERTRDKREKRENDHLMNGPTVDVQDETSIAS